jgi:hypothetical protein
MWIECLRNKLEKPGKQTDTSKAFLITVLSLISLCMLLIVRLKWKVTLGSALKAGLFLLSIISSWIPFP